MNKTQEHLIQVLIFGLIASIVMVLLMCSQAKAEISNEKAVHCILGESRGEYATYGYNSFLAIADALRNRGTTKGVYGCGVNLSKDMAYMAKKGYYSKALQAWIDSARVELVKGSSHWESTLFKTPYWAKDMKVTYQVGHHKFYK